MTILTGDCLDVLPTLDRESVDLIVTDPPYNIGIDYGRGTVPAVAQSMGREAIGIELNPEYAEIARQRVEVAA